MQSSSIEFDGDLELENLNFVLNYGMLVVLMSLERFGNVQVDLRVIVSFKSFL